MPFCPPDQIIIPPDRFRPADSAEVEQMAKSFKEVGQLHPILVDNNMNLVAGLHRLEAARKLDREIWYVTEEEGRLLLDNPYLRKMAEYQENIRRKEFSQAELNKAIVEVDRLMRLVYGEKKPGPGAPDGWTQDDTAKKLGYKSHQPVSHAHVIVTAIERGIPGVEEAKTTQEALKIAKTHIRLQAAEEKARRAEASGDTGEITNPMEFFSERLVLGDCLEKLRELPKGLCSFWVTDPPWKIDIDKAVEDHGSAVQKAVGIYDDSSDDIIPILKEAISQIYRVSKPDAWVVMFCGAKHWVDLYEHFRKCGFQVYSKPLVWVKTSSSGGTCSSKSPAPSMWPASVSDFMVLARKGEAMLAQLHKPDVFLQPPCQSADKCHHSQKPIPLLEEIISRFYHPGTNPVLIDPFAGSGSTLIAARRVGIKQYFGYELDPVNRERALVNMVNQYMQEQEKKDQLPTTTLDLEDF